jgi:hypothetical protein
MAPPAKAIAARLLCVKNSRAWLCIADVMATAESSGTATFSWAIRASSAQSLASGIGRARVRRLRR